MPTTTREHLLATIATLDHLREKAGADTEDLHDFLEQENVLDMYTHQHDATNDALGELCERMQDFINTKKLNV
jgi:hypothetical protein